MATLFKGDIILKNGVGYDVKYTVTATYTGTFHTLLNGGKGLEGYITLKAKSMTYAWSKDVTVGITFGGGKTASKQEVLSIGADDYTTHSATFQLTPSEDYYGSIRLWIKNNASGEYSPLAGYHATGIFQGNDELEFSYTGGLAGIYLSDFTPTFSLKGEELFEQKDYLGGKEINLNYYWTSPIFEAKIVHKDGHEKASPSYSIKYFSYGIDGTKRSQYAYGSAYKWKINKSNYTETIEFSLPLFLQEGSEELKYPIREYFLYYNGSYFGDSFYVTPVSFTFPNTIIAKQKDDDKYQAEINLGNINEWISSKYDDLNNALNFIFKVQNEEGEIEKIGDNIIGKTPEMIEPEKEVGEDILLVYEISINGKTIISKGINTIFGLAFSASISSCTRIIGGNSFGSLTTLQRGEEMTLEVEIQETSKSLQSEEEVKATLITRNASGQEKVIYSASGKWGEMEKVTFSNITINELIEVNSEKVNNLYLKIVCNDIEKTLNLGKGIYAYDYINSIITNDEIKYELISGQEKVNGQCNIKEGSLLEIGFPEGQFRDGLKIQLILGNYLYGFNGSLIQREVKYDVLRNLLNDSSGHIKITPTQKNPKEIPYEIQYSYGSGYNPISTEEKLIITIPPLLIPTLAYRSKQVGINCEPSEKSVLDIKAEQIIEKDDSGKEKVIKDLVKVSFQNKEGSEKSYIDLQDGGLKDANGNDIYLTQEEYKQKIIDNTSNITTINANIGTINTNIGDLIDTITSTRYMVVTRESDEINTYKNALTAGQVEFEKKLNFGAVPVSDYKFIIGTKFVSGNKDELFDSSNPLHIYSTTAASENGNIVVTCKGRYRERTNESNSAKFKVQGMLYYSMIST